MSKESCDLPVGKTCGLKTVGDQIIENFYRLFSVSCVPVGR